MSGGCGSCGAALAAGARFCSECGGAAAAAVCSGCGAVATGGRFCSECGTPAGGPPPAAPVAAPRVAERRVTSVLFGDLVGFTSLSEARDAEDVRELLSEYFALARTVVGRYGGTIEKFIGDAVMAVWGVPVANEDDAERAVRAGLDLVAAVSQMGEQVGAPGLAMRVGVVTGEVAVTLGATAEGMVAGDAVNTAARVQSAAQPGTVWVDEATRSLTAAAVTYADVGDHAMKGKAEPVRLFQAQVVVAAVGGAQRIDGLEAPFTGRERQLRLVKELCHETAEERRPRLVLVTGPAGVGKSRLAWEFFKYIDGLSETFAWHRGRCLSYGDGVAFWALAEVVRARLGLAESDPPSVVEAALTERLAAFLPDAAERGWAHPRLAALLGAGTGSFPREDLFAAWARFLERAGAGAPVVVVLDDLHVADEGLLDFLDHLLATSSGAVYVLALARPELLESRPGLLTQRRVTGLQLEPLADPAMAALVDGLVDGLDAGTRDALVARAEGIPLFAVETVRALIDRDLVVPRNGSYVLAEGKVDLASVGAPASLHALVAARLDALPAAERLLVSRASVLGLSFSVDGLRALAPDIPDLDEQVASLVRREVLSTSTDRFSADRGQLRFVQAVVRQVAYDTLSRRDRRAAHLLAAAHLSSEPSDELAPLIAQHYLDAVAAGASADADAQLLTEKAVALLGAAAGRALALGAHHEALALQRTALDCTSEPAERLPLLEQAAQAAELAGDYDTCLEFSNEVLAALRDTDPLRSGRTTAVAGRALSAAGRVQEAVEQLRPALACLSEDGNADAVRLVLLAALSRALTYTGADPDVVHDVRIRQLGVAERLGDAGPLSDALISAAIGWVLTGFPTTGLALLQHAADRSRRADLPVVQARALYNLGTLQLSRDLDASLVAFEEVLGLGTRAGAYMISLATMGQSVAQFLAGRWLPAAAVAHSVLGDERTDVGSRSIALAVQAWHDQATDGQVAALPDLPPSDDVSTEMYLQQARATALAHRGDLAGAAQACAESLASAIASSGLEDDVMHVWPRAVLSSLAAGLLEQAEAQVALVAAAPHGLVTPYLRAQLAHLQGLLLVARGRDPEALLREAIPALDAYGAVPDAARSRHAPAQWLLAEGRVGEAQPLIDEARRTYDELGAAVWLSELDALASSPA